MNAVILGIGIGLTTAVLDALLMLTGMRRAARNTQKASAIVTITLAARYLLLAAVLIAALTIGRERVNAVWIIIPMIIQKAVLLVISVMMKP